MSDVDKNMHSKYSIGLNIFRPYIFVHIAHTLPFLFPKGRDVQLKSLISIDTGMGQTPILVILVILSIGVLLV